ncbi:hypothetical protein STENM223S_06046 [Streptomyces tendae]
MADVRMPPTHTDEGVRAAVRLRKAHPGVGVLVLSQYVEERYATELLAGSSRGVGYLLKDRVAEVREFVDAVVRVAQGGTALDPEVVAQLLGRSRKQDVLAGLTPREREVLGLMAEGRTNSAIARQLVVSDGAVEKHVIHFLKLGLSPSDGDHRRVLAVLTYLNSRYREAHLRSGGPVRPGGRSSGRTRNRSPPPCAPPAPRARNAVRFPGRGPRDLNPITRISTGRHGARTKG